MSDYLFKIEIVDTPTNRLFLRFAQKGHIAATNKICSDVCAVLLKAIVDAAPIAKKKTKKKKLKK